MGRSPGPAAAGRAAGELFSPGLARRIDALKRRRRPRRLGRVAFESPLLLAPMSAITDAPFRLLMGALGAGGTVSELVSCHGVNQGNARSRRLLRVHPEEGPAGLQLFGEDAGAMARAAATACEVSRPAFIDVNMGCPVRKVVSKGAGSALLREPAKLGRFFAAIRRAVPVPLSIKIRTGWDEGSRNADEVLRVAAAEGVEWAAVHGRTRAQGYRGEADWAYMERLAGRAPLPVVGNGDLHSAGAVRARLARGGFPALMLGRGPLRDPFIFLAALAPQGAAAFGPEDVLETALALARLLDGEPAVPGARPAAFRIKKHLLWLAHGLPGAGDFRRSVVAAASPGDALDLARRHFLGLAERGALRRPDPASEAPFLAGGHG